jgi:hypothetical protein
MKPFSSFDRRHPRRIALLRTAIGLWLLGLTLFLCATGRWWGLLLAPFAALHFLPRLPAAAPGRALAGATRPSLSRRLIRTRTACSDPASAGY